ncbi:hypothetical protein CFN58_06375 [Pseudomonas avellanae]|uniref:Uncharacterized protein n=1 Tax=Pseudomonas avellanae TaxID=46257 RepID=A0A261WLQ1_9PSED|nr:hypothetical protein JN853_23180 [Pseudomonas syringae pv. actinidiae ICMP 9853]NAS66698.1 hypothetical protein [Pseudomonas syringae pv. actinidiae]OZI87078.1 hypothetical protein CFN58_06375 [Pseudomonas avellanae]NAS74482.1 hypothetical protein [Pseudomonas syringae pv. actinidiae]NAT08394.1 hypothetical protein [Pseudomonas syringae pv. actinidiae]
MPKAPVIHAPVSARRTQELQKVTTAAMGCEAAPRPVASVVSGTPRRLVLLPVPGSSRTSEASLSCTR